MTLIGRIIKTFMHNPMPDDVQVSFAEWLLSEDDSAAKHKALEQEWNSMCESSLEDSVSSVTRWSRLREIHRKIDNVPSRRRGLFLSWGAVAACAAALCLAATLHFVFGGRSVNERQTCYVTSSSGKGEFTLPDGSRVWLNSDSRLEFTGDLSGKVRNVDLYGEAFFDVNPSESYFVVNMGGVRVKVLGTEFNARNSELYGDYEITLNSGKVQVESERFSPVTLAPGQQFHAPFSLETASVRKVNTCNYSSWTGESLVLENRRLQTVITNLEHWYNINISLGPEIDKDIRLSMTIRHESADKTLDLISTLVGCSYTYTAEDTVLITR